MEISTLHPSWTVLTTICCHYIHKLSGIMVDIPNTCLLAINIGIFSNINRLQVDLFVSFHDTCVVQKFILQYRIKAWHFWNLDFKYNKILISNGLSWFMMFIITFSHCWIKFYNFLKFTHDLLENLPKNLFKNLICG